MHPIPPSIRDVINAFEPPDGFIILPPRRNDKSVIFAFGVRLVEALENPSAEPNPSSPAIWMCLAGEDLKKAHEITSEKTDATQERRRSRENELERVRDSQMFRDDPARVYVLIETLRIVYNNLPYRLGEYEESITIRELVFKQATINSKIVCHSIVKLYASTKRVLEGKLPLSRVGSAPTFTAAPDFWSSKMQNVKYVGLRLYMKFDIESILLGTRHFVPHHGERQGGPDVKYMMSEGLKLQWQWCTCIPHMTNAATKAACGMATNASTSKNPVMTDLIRRIVKPIYTVKHVEVTGSLRSAYPGTQSVWIKVEVKARIYYWISAEKRLSESHTDFVAFAAHNSSEHQESGRRCKPGQSFVDLVQAAYYSVDCSKELRDYRSTKTHRMTFRPKDLTALATSTRSLLQDAFHERFFYCYTNRKVMIKCSIVLEMQLFLHPNFKIFDGVLKKMIFLCNTDENGTATAAGERHFAKIKKIIYDKVRAVMLSVVTTPDMRIAASQRACLELLRDGASTSSKTLLGGPDGWLWRSDA
ncbi:hypothetical protein GN958_ATG01169 [Phytophthora infestans]|uniref:Uncharacterized protein n=1 Tax=Phytophthora infestans TaxID=4787 RepID=A0A8S9V9U0_PHYIN|nr:hypothetical protein GN958_ATG01169 [Phytophthora infestans]